MTAAAAVAAALGGMVEAMLRGLDGAAETGVSLLPEGLEAFALRALAAREAKHSLDLQYYAWHNDVTGRLLAREALLAADRGVRVRLLLDDSYALGAERPLGALSAHSRIDVRLFNATTPRWRSWGRIGLAVEFLLGGWHLNHRMHNKAWIADRRLAIAGGRNIGDEYFDADAEAGFNFRDLDLVVAGAAAAQAEAVFERYWTSPLSRRIEGFATRRERRAAARRLPDLRRRLEAAAASAEARPYLERLAASPAVARILRGEGGHALVPAEDVRILADPPEKAAGAPPGADCVAAVVDDALRGARREALLISPYFVPGEEGATVLTELVRRGVRVSVVTNSLAATDVVAVHGGYARYRRPLLEAGIAIHELKRSGNEGGGVFGSRGASLHTKALAVDGELIFVGSFNLDPRSANLNTEMGALARHPELARRLRAEHDRLTDPGRSYRLALDRGGRLVWIDRGPAGGERRRVGGEPDASLRRRVLAALVRWLPIESQL